MRTMRNMWLALAVPASVIGCATKAATPVEMAPAPMLASDEVAPATQPAPQALPAGHPDITQLLAERKAANPLNGAAPVTPPPTVKLPSGHPDIAAMRKPSTQNSINGTLTIVATQGTSGGPAIKGLPVKVELFSKDELFDKREAKLDANGKLVLSDIPVSLGIQPKVLVNYNGVVYDAIGEAMDTQNPTQQVKVGIYEPTEQEPAWTIHMQHLIVEPTVDGVTVMEMLSVENPADHAWIGKLGADNKRTTVSFPLPEGASNVQLSGGFLEGATDISGTKIVTAAPLLPGPTQYRMVYSLPVSNGAANIAISAPTAVKNLMIFVPSDGSVVKAEGLESGTADMGNGPTRYFKGADLKAGQEIKLAISNITAKVPTAEGEIAAATPAPFSASNHIAKLMAGVGGLVIFVVGGFLLLVKSPKQTRNAKRAKAA